MDPASVRALACASKQPLGLVFKTMVDNYLEEHRSRTLLGTKPEAPNDRCIYKVTRGRCRKKVPGVAITQYCAKHQPGGGICFPGDGAVCRWNFHDLMQNKCRNCGQNARGGEHYWGSYYCRVCRRNFEGSMQR